MEGGEVNDVDKNDDTNDENMLLKLKILAQKHKGRKEGGGEREDTER